MQVVPARDALGVADPSTDNVDRKVFKQFRLARRTGVLPDLWPGIEPSLLDEPDEMRVRVVARKDGRQAMCGPE